MAIWKKIRLDLTLSALGLVRFQVPPLPARVVISDKLFCCSAFLLPSTPFCFLHLDCEFFGEEMLHIYFRIANAYEGKVFPV